MDQRKNQFIVVVNIVLILVALILGYFIYQQRSTSESIRVPDNSDKKNVLLWPPQNASVEEKQRHDDLVRSLAADAEFLDILSDCTAQPVVLRVRFGETFTIRNQDIVDHVITVNEDNIFSIPVGGTKDVKADFGKGRGNYGFVCDSRTGVSGILHVTP